MKLSHLTKYSFSSGHSIPALGLGLYGMAPSATPQLVKRALDVGYRNFDSAEFYKNHSESSSAISEWVKNNNAVKRDDVFFSTKIKGTFGYEKTKKEIDDAFLSAQKSGLEYIDLLLILSPMSNKQRRLEAWKAFQEAQQDGKVKSIGVASFGISHLQEIFDWDGLTIPPAVNQVELHPYLMRNDITSFCRGRDIILEAFSPLMHGKGWGKDEVLKDLSVKYKRSEAQILIRWSLQHGFVPLPKSSSENRVEENFDVYDFEIEKEDMEKLNRPDSYKPSQPAWDPTVFSK